MRHPVAERPVIRDHCGWTLHDDMRLAGIPGDPDLERVCWTCAACGRVYECVGVSEAAARKRAHLRDSHEH